MKCDHCFVVWQSTEFREFRQRGKVFRALLCSGCANMLKAKEVRS